MLLALAALVVRVSADTPAVAVRYHDDAHRLIAAALSDSSAYSRIAELSDRFGNRISGSPALEAAIDWVLAKMKADGLANVHGEPVSVPHWVRGEESAELVTPRRVRLHMLGLGGSIGTPHGGITAPVLVVSSFADLQRHAAEAKGKIVVFDVAYPDTLTPFGAYSAVVPYRVTGAIAAARVGAVASLIRSIASLSLQSPHTGVMIYDSTVQRIPHAALSVEDAELLHRMQGRGDHPTLHLVMGARKLADTPSRNVVAEVVGREHPEEVVVLGGHIDSWDVGEGAMDDAGGAVASWEAVRLLQRLGLHPRRTVRVVLWTSEEFGGVGGRAYREAHRADEPRHIAAMESDNGVFSPRGVRFTGSDSARAIVRQIGTLLKEIGADSVTPNAGETDIAPLVADSVPGFGLDVDASKYFRYHHSDADTPDKLDPAEVARCVATLAVYAYVLADLAERLPR
ncbi:MAG TPA: M20/M25/M40 family metallo-hydrolase [Gemmatimonadaceae bacterium]|nr:M20/M25/M40 family metallo-hydrolase [Gemmatimonadaceae bacterium]